MKSFRVDLQGILEFTSEVIFMELGSTAGSTVINFSLTCGSLVKVISQPHWVGTLHQFLLLLFRIFFLICNLNFHS